MKRERDVISLPILDKNQGNKIATIKDIVYSKNKLRILGFLVSDGNFFPTLKYIQFKNIESIGSDAIMIKSRMALEDPRAFPEIESLIEEKRRINGEEVLTENGDSLGLVYDTIFDGSNGKILGFVLTDGLFQDLKEGRNILPCMKGITYGDQALIVSNEIKGQFEKNKETFKKLLELQ
ncbi:PRC-barrel domain-containing protein [Sporosalibacterium faouarense]|uniref:PRC-barrel domain-containing protein n=1 Tax=Sporosalibacterium faouarense TaxID=516123 RepID=UPI00141D1E4E|nr:PRC-barrel domain-containing protein [Sporosalibacterium faouarense]MTI48976.1 hypothetical protein [Bacillota bacterium]